MEKSEAAFRTIGEVSDELGIAQHILRYWETRFPQLKPITRAGNRRYYRPEDVELVRRIQHLLEQDGYTVKGVQRLLASRRTAIHAPDTLIPEQPSPAAPADLPIAELRAIRDRLAAALDAAR
jgi:DNA-binding transcriptional MerR regulator